MSLLRCALLGMLAVAACMPTGLQTSLPTESNAAAAAPTPSVSASPSLVPKSSLSLTDAANCPVTKPGRAPRSSGFEPFGTANAYGNDALWVTAIQPGGVILVDHRFINVDGSISWKFGWYRLVPGTLAITGRRFDAEAPPLLTDVPSGYGSTGFQASGVDFPTEGCWQITGALGAARLTFVVFVLRTE